MRATAAPQSTGRSSARPRLSPTSADFPLTGPSALPDPRFNAFRKDLADVALAGAVIASHYAEPLDCTLANDAILRAAPSCEGEQLAELAQGTPFRMLDNSVGWAWGYAGDDQRVGYVPADAVTAA